MRQKAVECPETSVAHKSSFKHQMLVKFEMIGDLVSKDTVRCVGGKVKH